MKLVGFSLEQGNKYYGRIDGQRFFIGSRVSYGGYKGLMNVKGSQEQKYDRNDYRPSFGLWADFIHPTAVAEGALFHTLNTYDRARFTFSFLQYGAHVPNGDFVDYLRALLALPSAHDYFPDLAVENGRVCRVTDSGLMPIEDDASTEGLMDYLNPSLNEIEDTEIIQAAKFIHWAQNDPEHRQVQVNVGVARFKKNMHQYAKQYGLDGVEDRICLVIADIRHQGRARSSAIRTALASSDPFNALLGLGDEKYAYRIKTLRREIARLTSEGSLGRKVYRIHDADFV